MRYIFSGFSLHQSSCNWNLELETRKVVQELPLTIFILPFQISTAFFPLAPDLQLRWESREPLIAPPRETMEFYPPISIGKLQNPFTLQRKRSVQAKVRFVSRAKRENLEIRSQLLLFSSLREKRGCCYCPWDSIATGHEHNRLGRDSCISMFSREERCCNNFMVQGGRLPSHWKIFHC